MNGYVRFRNSRWVSGTEAKASFKLIKTDKKPELILSKSKVFINSKYGKDKETIRVTLNDSVIPDMKKIKWSSDQLPKNVKVVKNENNGTITISGGAEVTALYDKITSTPVLEDAAPYYKELRKILNENVPSIPLFVYERLAFATAKLDGLILTEVGDINFSKCYFK